IQPASAVTVTVVKTNVSCFGGSDGTATATGLGGTGTITYLWSNTQTGATATGLTAGTYDVTATDVNGCTAVASVVITEQPQLTASITAQTDVLCNGASTGSATVTAVGGTAPYTYNWNDSVTTKDRTGLAAGSYSVSIRDNNGCFFTVNCTVTAPLLVSGTTVLTNVSCFSGANGAINLTPSGGTAPYTFNWGGGITTEDRTGVAAGTYSVIITDANGCTGTVSGIIVTQPLAITPSFAQVAPICSGGTLAALPTTSTNSIVGTWSPALDNTTTTIYTFTPNIGQCGTTASMTITVNTTAQPTRDNTISGTLCNGATIGTLISKFNNSTNVLCYAAASGGSNLSSNLVISPVNTNVAFYLTQTVAGCESTRVLYNAYVNFVTPPTAAATQSFCAGATVANLAATPGAAGGSPACCLNWYTTSSGGTALSSSTTLATGTYYVGQSHISSCAIERTLVNVIVSNPNTTITEASGILTATESSATYQWYKCPSTLISGATNQSYTPTVVGDYKVDITTNGCTLTSSCFTLVTLTTADFDTASFKYYPNPTNGILNVNYSSQISKIQVSNLLGQEVLTKNINSKEGQIDMQFLPSGTYLVKIYSEDKVKTIKVVKQ
ncbi:MAG: T9SS type A sorting domain-containing protein, partial [Flavobacterium sp.]|uniref:T9SS type A sorting domain-containing protein n=1 Tax=Flavobacterium sp. TaxID=239 RepID=UPI00326389AD